MDSIVINHEESYLLNKLDDYPLTKGEGKFDNDGNPLHWPGCTIICPIQESSLVSSLLSEVQENFKKIAPKKKYTFLPQSSFHMTLFDCCNVRYLTYYRRKRASGTTDHNILGGSSF